MAFTPNVVDGNIILAAWGNEIRDRSVQVFATVAERDAQWPAPPRGAVCVTLDTDTLWKRGAAAWVAIAGPAAWSPFTPTLTASPTNPSLGTGMCDAHITLGWGSTGASTGTGVYTVGGLPVPFGAGVAAFQVVGHGALYLSNGGVRSRNNCQALMNSATDVQVYVPELWSSTVPAAPTFNDAIRLALRYEV
jgi:hypothetical protein